MGWTRCARATVCRPPAAHCAVWAQLALGPPTHRIVGPRARGVVVAAMEHHKLNRRRAKERVRTGSHSLTLCQGCPAGSRPTAAASDTQAGRRGAAAVVGMLGPQPPQLTVPTGSSGICGHRSRLEGQACGGWAALGAVRAVMRWECTCCHAVVHSCLPATTCDAKAGHEGTSQPASKTNIAPKLLPGSSAHGRRT